MDRDVIRVLVLVIGLLVIAGMIAWSFFKHEKTKREFDEFDALHQQNPSPISEINQQQEFDDGDEIGEDAASNEIENIKPEAKRATPAMFKNKLDPISEQAENVPTINIPPVLQFSIMAKTEQGFNGLDLVAALTEVNLKYGNLQIFERLDAQRLVDFGVANMVKPGIFPQVNLGDFYCPGIVFFMQPSHLDDPVAVFEDYIRTLNFVAIKLEGQMLDHHRHPLSDATIQAIRQSL